MMTRMGCSQFLWFIHCLWMICADGQDLGQVLDDLIESNHNLRTVMSEKLSFISADPYKRCLEDVEEPRCYLFSYFLLSTSFVDHTQFLKRVAKMGDLQVDLIQNDFHDYAVLLVYKPDYFVDPFNELVCERSRRFPNKNRDTKNNTYDENEWDENSVLCYANVEYKTFTSKMLFHLNANNFRSLYAVQTSNLWGQYIENDPEKFQQLLIAVGARGGAHRWKKITHMLVTIIGLNYFKTYGGVVGSWVKAHMSRSWGGRCVGDGMHGVVGEVVGVWVCRQSVWWGGQCVWLNGSVG